MRRFTGLVLATLWLAACTSPPVTSQAPSRAPAPSNLPRTSPIEDCGTFVLQQGDEFPSAAAACFVAAVQAERAARLQVTRPSVEGDPIPVTYTAAAGGSSKAVLRETCEGAVLAKGEITLRRCSAPTPLAS
jgi:hypothetical protein